jgi:hypothetical protein
VVTPRPPGQTLTYLVLVAGGFLLGVVGAGLSAVRIEVAGLTVPWGLALVLTALGVGARSAAWLVGHRRGAIAVTLGWVLPTLAFAALTPGGDVLLPDLPRTYVYLLGGLLVAGLASVIPLPPGAREEAESALIDPPEEPPPLPEAPEPA